MGNEVHRSMFEEIKSAIRLEVLRRYGDGVRITPMSNEIDVHHDEHFVVRIRLEDEKAVIESCVVSIPIEDAAYVGPFDSCHFVASYLYCDPQFVDRLFDTVDAELDRLSD